jgi:hypothetical protein
MSAKSVVGAEASRSQVGLFKTNENAEIQIPQTIRTTE